MRILLTGSKGQLGTALMHRLSKDHVVIELDRARLDLLNFKALNDFLVELDVDLVLNAAAWTDINQAEINKKDAHDVNVESVALLASYAAKLDIPMIHFSSDYVFEGKLGKFYREDDVIFPISVYAKTKWAGEEILRQLLHSHIILRTSWIFSAQGDFFFNQIISYALHENKIEVVDDQWGSPTSALSISNIVHNLLKYQNLENFYGTIHVRSDSVINRLQFAQNIVTMMGDLGFKKMLSESDIEPVSSSCVLGGFLRPKHPVLDVSKFKHIFQMPLPSWEDDAYLILKQLKI
jgi:dTDP-4-dehydrorhamnose reductase